MHVGENTVLKALFPFSRRSTTVGSLIVTVIGYLIAGALTFFLCSWLAELWLIGRAFDITLSVIYFYLFAGIIVSVLIFLGIIK